MGSGPRIQIRHPHTAHLLEIERPDLGRFGGADWTPSLRPKAGGQEAQACQHSPGHAHPPDSPVPTTGLQYVGVRSGAAPDFEWALRHYVRRGLKGAIQGRRGSRILYLRSRIQLAASG